MHDYIMDKFNCFLIFSKTKIMKFNFLMIIYDKLNFSK